MSRWRRVWTTSWRLLVCLVLLGWLLHGIFLNEAREVAQAGGFSWAGYSRWEQMRLAWTFGPPELWRHLTAIPPLPFGLSLLVMGGILLLGVLRWRMVLRVHGLPLSFTRAGEISFVAHFFNSLLLGSTGGDLMKAYYAARETHHLKTEAVVTVFVDRVLGLWAMLLFAGLMMPWNLALLTRHERLRSFALVMIVMLLACTLFLALLFWGGVSRRWTGARDWLRRLPKGDLLENLLQSCRRFGREPSILAKALFLSMGLNALCVLQVLILSWGLGLNIPASALFLVVPLIICISAIPVTPSGLGVRENLYVFTLAVPLFGVSAASALSLSLLAYAGSLIWSLAGGVVYLMFKERHHLREVELEATQPGVDQPACTGPTA